MAETDFKFALTVLQNGHRATREEWVHTSYVALLPGYPEGILANENNQKAHCIAEGAMLTFEPYFQAMSVDSKIRTWSPTTEDVLAKDWKVITD